VCVMHMCVSVGRGEVGTSAISDRGCVSLGMPWLAHDEVP